MWEASLEYIRYRETRIGEEQGVMSADDDRKDGGVDRRIRRQSVSWQNIMLSLFIAMPSHPPVFSDELPVLKLGSVDVDVTGQNDEGVELHRVKDEGC
ncbi:hypothetical protein PM082_004227 [Marasmius tenuissimus]|nr:hypothetical protein PM082_004227 [Marasmius tenuissimus]